jgi:ParB/RepB/Spo0J family partition protein
MFQADPNTIVEIPLSQIVAIENWNSRSGRWEVNDGDDEGQQFDDLVASIRTKGQEEPCDVRCHPTLKEHYLLTAGFRRYKALCRIADDGQSAVTIRCIVQAADDVQARIRNLSENTTRQNISTPDLAWGIHELHKVAIANGRPLTNGKIAALIGKSESYVGHLLTIMTKCKPAITKKWRSMPKSLSVLTMHAVALMPKADQDAAFAALLVPIEQREKPDTQSSRQHSWVDNAKAKAYTVGVLIGQLEAHGLIDTSSLEFSRHIDLIVPLRDTCTTVQRDAIVIQAEKGYKQGVRREKIPRIVGDL